MLKVRLMGSTKDIKWYRKMMARDSRIQVVQESEILPLGNTPRYFRAYSQVERTDGNDGRNGKKKKKRI